MTAMVDNVMEIITVEIVNEKSKNVFVFCVYRAPGTSVESLTDIITELFDQNHTKEVFLCGNFNIDMENPGGLNSLYDFTNTMYGLGLFPIDI